MWRRFKLIRLLVLFCIDVYIYDVFMIYYVFSCLPSCFISHDFACYWSLALLAINKINK